MAARSKRGPSRAVNGNGGDGPVLRRLDRLERHFIAAQRDTNTQLARIGETLKTSSKLFELMHERLESLEEGQQALVEGQQALVEGQKLVVERLDRLVAASTRDRTEQVERIVRLEQRVEKLEHKG